MADLSSKFTRRDMEILLEAVGDWESQGMHEWHFSKYIKEIPLPPEDHEAYELVKSAKEHSKREQNIADRKDAREEEAIFLKAKLLLNRKQMNMDSLFEMPLDTSAPPPVVEVVPAKAVTIAQPVDNDGDNGEVAELREKLRLAEFYIQDLGVTKMYEEFLADRQKEKLEESK